MCYALGYVLRLDLHCLYLDVANQTKTEFSLTCLPKQLSKSLTLLFSCLSMSRLLHLTLRVTSVSYSSPCLIIFLLYLNLALCLFPARHRIRNTLDSTTAKNIATSLIHSKVDYCNSLFLNLPCSQLDHL